MLIARTKKSHVEQIQAVIRVSKKYLPGMSVGFQHPNVKVHVADGFKFLADRKNEFDVIITDSSDPEGPAEALFQKPYFELLFNALREGGVVTTQGCSSISFPSSSARAITAPEKKENKRKMHMHNSNTPTYTYRSVSLKGHIYI